MAIAEDDPNKVFGVDFSPGRSFGGSTARNVGLQSIQQSMKPHFAQARSTIERRGLGRLYAPAVESSITTPLVEAGARRAGQLATDVHYKDIYANIAQNTSRETLKGAKKQRKQAGAGTVLCTALYRQGMLPLGHIKADVKYLRRYLEGTQVHADYIAWSSGIANKMLESKLLCYVMYTIVKPWSDYMKAVVEGTRQPIIGKCIHFFGVKYGSLYRWITKR